MVGDGVAVRGEEMCEFRHQPVCFLSPEFVRMMSRWAVPTPPGFLVLVFNLPRLKAAQPGPTDEPPAWSELPTGLREDEKTEESDHIWEPWERRCCRALAIPLLLLLLFHPAQANQQMHFRLIPVYFKGNKMSDAGWVFRTVAAESDYSK